MTSKGSNDNGRVSRAGHLRWVPIAKMKINLNAQRPLRQHKVDSIVADLDIEQLGVPTVSERDGSFHVLDGQHRIQALRDIGWGDQQVQCWCYAGLTEEEEAEIFLKLNDVLPVDTFSKFRVGIAAGRSTETEIDRVVRAQGLVVSADQIPGAIKAVAALRRVHARGGSPTLGRTLRIIRDAYGDAGMVGPVIEGIGLLCGRYNGQLDDTVTVERLSKMHGGVNGLLNQAEVLRQKTGNQKVQCVAAAAVNRINGVRGGKKLPSWWADA